MIKKSLTIILGAGASVPYGYPTGAGLIQQIVGVLDWKVLDRNNTLAPLKLVALRSNQFTNFHIAIADFCFAVRRNNPTNIDSFLRDNPSLEKIGRTLIAYLIRISEYNDYGYIVPPDNQFNPWYHVLFDAMVSRTPPEKIPESQQLRIVTFNYDVSLEYYLAKALLDNERTRPHAKAIFDSIPVLHIFGSVGTVSIENDVVKYAYGNAATYQNGAPKQLVQEVWNPSEHCNLHVAIENKHTHKDVIQASQTAMAYMERSEHILCMGFDFAADNCDLLKISDEEWGKKSLVYLNYDKAPALDSRATRWCAHRNRYGIHADCFNALTREYDLVG